ncbi:hypothetical protein SELR_17920 [Selenomonas ruminantium subsp. lactilytica TAM6421]|uniref:Uncharacterized protein n=1 Tax=Selenomonas ruminantium subsp. lactilytica (strain NBRC 103574 / TAM6421) TaxID=927704 RepID=I0GRW3_SELRL|nr:hypothetical protein [Selenomonas ruminantium]BAL83500.1 hypothetical protein SELR_17920 [Selenomonas ruminantium subsp. lactilytica TAM6421]
MGEEKKIWYGVTSSYDDKGHVAASITMAVESKEAPKPSFTETQRRDIYTDWFESEAEAKAFVEKSRRA